MPLLRDIADAGGFDDYAWKNFNARSGIYLYKGSLTNFHLSERFNLKFTDLNLLIASLG
jgi:alanine dehydrogenase